MNKPGFSDRVPELDGLRGLAILLVILCHYVGNPDHSPLGFWPHRFLLAFTAGWSGVDLFFVLSGFLIGGILLDARNAPNYFRTFYMRRVFRILPIYYLWTLLFSATLIVALVFFPGRLDLTSSDFLRVPIQLLFLQNIFIGMPHFTWMWFAVTWTLAVEEQFYLLAPPLIRFLTQRTLAIVLIATIALAPLLRFLLFRFWAPGTYLCAFLMPCRADSLSAGILLAMAWRNARFMDFIRSRIALLHGALALLFLGVGGLLWWLVHPILKVVTITLGFTWLAFFYSVLLLLVLSNPRGWVAATMRLQFLIWLGGISYCVYMLHDAFNFFGVASFSWHFFEKPLIKRGHRYTYGKVVTQSIASLSVGQSSVQPEIISDT